MKVTISDDIRALPLSLLHLPKRSHNALERCEINTVGVFIELPEADLENIPRLGTKNLEILQNVRIVLKETITDSGEIDWPLFWEHRGIKIIPQAFKNDTPEHSILNKLPSIIKEVLEQNSDGRLWFILQRRLGLENTQKLTLEELGLAFGLTRERVRQLEAIALKELRAVLMEDDYKDKSFHVHPSIINAVRKLSRIVTERTGQAILENELLSQIESDFNIRPEDIKPSIELILNLSGLSKLELPKDDLQPLWGKFESTEAKSLQSFIERLDKLLTEECSLPLSEIDILVRTNKGARKRNRLTLDQLKYLIKLCSSIELHKEGFYRGKFENLVGRGNQVERILFEYGEPLHINEITREMNHRLALYDKKTVNARNLANQMSSDDRFVPIGRSGEWGLSGWSVDTGTIIDLMKQYLISQNKPSTADEIFTYVRERRPVQKSSIDSYLIFQDDFAKVDRNNWGLSEWAEAKDAQNWNPEQVGQFVEELFRKNRARKLKYSIVKQALIEAANIKDRQAQGLLNVNPVIKTERDDNGELIAIFQPKYRDLLASSGARFVRRKSTLRTLVDEKVRKTLETSPGNQIALSDLVNLLVDEFKRRDKTFYHYISDLDYVEKFTIPDTRTVMCRLKRNEASLPFPQVEDIQSPELRLSIGRALTFLNENDVDIALFLLSKEFEATLRSYLLIEQSKGRLQYLTKNRLSLDVMINLIKKEGIITDQAILHFLRQERNDRAHGTMPSLEERKMMMKHSHNTAGMYIDYIKYFDDLAQALKQQDS